MRRKHLAQNRSDRIARALLRAAGAAAVVAFAMTGSAVGQDSLQVAGAPRVHVVQTGETLWDLAQRYFGDPFLWPEIYRINTLVVEDPHWIYPGEELRLVVADATAAVGPELQPGEVPTDAQGVEQQPEAPEPPPVELPGAPPPPPPIEESGPTVFSQARPQVAAGVRAGALGSYRAVGLGDFYGAGFLTEGDELPWGEVSGRTGQRGRDRIGGPSAMLNGSIQIRAPEGATYHVGDSLLTARLSREVPGWGRIVVPTGLARVTHVSGRDVIAEVVTLFGRVIAGQATMPIEPFRNPGSARPAPVADGVGGALITSRDRHTVPNQRDVMFIDVGRQDGVVPGDVFEVITPEEDRTVTDAPTERLALLQIVHVRERSATGLLFPVKAPGVRDGIPVRLIGKMPS